MSARAKEGATFAASLQLRPPCAIRPVRVLRPSGNPTYNSPESFCKTAGGNGRIAGHTVSGLLPNGKDALGSAGVQLVRRLGHSRPYGCWRGRFSVAFTESRKCVDGAIGAPGDSNVRLSVRSQVDIAPGESEPLDVAVRLNDEEDAFGWNNASYQPPYWRNPAWRLPGARYRVTVTVKTQGQEWTQEFALNNESSREQFRLTGRPER